MRKNPFLELSKSTNTQPFLTEEIVLDHSNLNQIFPDDLKKYPNLQHLYIPFNNLKILNNLDHNIRLTYIDARNNQISEINLQKQFFITDLYLSNNLLSDLEVLVEQISHLRYLTSLDLRENPITLEKGYRNFIINKMKNLKILDGIEISKKDRKKIESNSTIIIKRSRPKSILQSLIERPLSSADIDVKKKARMIHVQSELKKQKEIEEQTAISRKRKEEFEAAANIKIAPFSEALDFLNKNKPLNTTKNREKLNLKRPNTRMFVKRSLYKKAEYLIQEEKLMSTLNPELPPIFSRFESIIQYPY